MATLAENLQIREELDIALEEAVGDIAEAIEEKGQDLTDVPLTGYADKIRAITSGGGEQPTLFTPTLDINLTNGVLTIKDGNGSFPTYFIEVNGENSFYTLETKSKSIMLEYEGIEHNENQVVSVVAKADKFIDSETVSVEWGFFAGTYGLSYTLNDDGLSYTCSGIGEAVLTDGRLVIPNQYMGLPVTETGSNAFKGNTNIKELVISHGVKLIGSASFNTCYIESISLPDSLETIKNASFSRGASVEKLIIPNSVKSIEEWAFANNTEVLKEVIFKGKPNYVDGYTFGNTPLLTSIKVPWAEGEVAGAPWGANNATITYNYTEDE